MALTKVSSSFVSDNSIGLAHLNSGVDGNLLTWDASGNPAYVVTGTSSQILTSNGAGAAPTFQTPAVTTGIIQRVVTEVSAASVTSVAIPFDSTIPQITEGTEIATRSITPTNASNILEIEAIGNFVGQGTAGGYQTTALFVDSTADSIAVTAGTPEGYNTPSSPLRLWHRLVAGSTSARTYKVRVGANTGVVSINQSYGSGVTLGGVSRFWLIVTEITA